MSRRFTYVLSFENRCVTGRTVAISAAIAAASVPLTVSNSVQLVYQDIPCNGEGFLNILKLQIQISVLHFVDNV